VLTDEKGEFVSAMSLVLDVTEQVRAQEEREKLSVSMLQTQKLESLGILAGGLAHDFNNLLTGMLGNAELISSSCRPTTRCNPRRARSRSPPVARPT
jgi:nitrogen-specific signal transduction histidine kinase